MTKLGAPLKYNCRLIGHGRHEGSSHPRTWKTLAAGELEIHEVPGDHASVLAEMNVEIWGKQLSDDLRRAQAEWRGSEGRDQRSGGFRISDCGSRILFGLLKRFTHRYLANSEIRHSKFEIFLSWTSLN
jgi:hypothetical protein